MIRPVSRSALAREFCLAASASDCTRCFPIGYTWIWVCSVSKRRRCDTGGRLSFACPRGAGVESGISPDLGPITRRTGILCGWKGRDRKTLKEGARTLRTCRSWAASEKGLIRGLGWRPAHRFYQEKHVPHLNATPL
eukprot:1193617-Prorocentrum_minimum.AAC.4